ncbi:hypothetical protein HPB48_005611 [Haemaphysalis longicornis]|uniref:Ig-like domain-containing protein n=1 Tax=Haemaphysalis longicornis TaxID=44386 RepID=A0A9J6GGK4_HAELO|nr:hypothetical protein HPB48_005611 [Haemaphysalis longicornis]
MFTVYAPTIGVRLLRRVRPTRRLIGSLGRLEELKTEAACWSPMFVARPGRTGNFGGNPVRSSEQEGPRFQEEPPGLVEFTNAKEASVPCQAVGRPPPAVRWIKLPDGVVAAEVPGLRYVRPDGSLVFPKFAPKDFRQDVHATQYRCVATNSVGSVASRDVKVRAD